MNGQETNLWPEFEQAKLLAGPAYDAHRDALLNSTPDLEAKLLAYRQGQPWQTPITAAMLDGWRKHAALYKSVLDELNSIDIEWERKKVTGMAGIWEAFALRAHQEFKTDILPLCWEVILKHAADWPQWKVITFLRMMEAVPDERSVDPLISFLETASDAAMQDVAAQTLKRQPTLKAREAIRRRLQSTSPPAAPAAERLQGVLSTLK